MNKRSCNLHGACGGKEHFLMECRGIETRCNLHGACGGKVAMNNS